MSSGRAFLYCLSFILIISCTTIIKTVYFDSNAQHEQLSQHFMQESDKTETLETIHLEIKKQIRSLQEDGDCEQKKILHCESAFWNYAGFGSMMMRYGVCAQVAYGLGRMFFIHEPRYLHFGGLSRFFDYESKNCSHLKNTYMTSESKCDMHSPSCYREGYEIDNSYKVLIYNLKNAFPAPRRIPGTIPPRLEERLKKLGVEEPWLWFTSQFLSYIMLQFKPYMTDLINRYRTEMRYIHPLVSIHFRHGDKLGSEAQYIKEDKFLSIADEYYKDNITTNITKRKIFVASDDPEIMIKLNRVRSDFEYIRIPSPPVSGSYFQSGFPKEIFENMIVDIYFLAYGNYTICTFTSNICRIIWSLKAGIPPYKSPGRVYSMDENIGFEYKPKKLIYYQWFGWCAARIIPYSNLWVTIDSSPILVDVPLGLTGLPRTMGYAQGALLNVDPASRRYVTFNDGNYSVVHAKRDDKGPWVEGVGYVFEKDLVPWPGTPSYHFYN